MLIYKTPGELFNEFAIVSNVANSSALKDQTFIYTVPKTSNTLRTALDLWLQEQKLETAIYEETSETSLLTHPDYEFGIIASIEEADDCYVISLKVDSFEFPETQEFKNGETLTQDFVIPADSFTRTFSKKKEYLKIAIRGAIIVTVASILTFVLLVKGSSSPGHTYGMIIGAIIAFLLLFGLEAIGVSEKETLYRKELNYSSFAPAQTAKNSRAIARWLSSVGVYDSSFRQDSPNEARVPEALISKRAASVVQSMNNTLQTIPRNGKVGWAESVFTKTGPNTWERMSRDVFNGIDIERIGENTLRVTVQRCKIS